MEDKPKECPIDKMLKYLEENKADSEVGESLQKVRILAQEAYISSKTPEGRKNIVEQIFDLGHTLQNRGNMNPNLKIDRVDCREKPRKSMPSAKELEQLEQKGNGN